VLGCAVLPSCGERRAEQSPGLWVQAEAEGGTQHPLCAALWRSLLVKGTLSKHPPGLMGELKLNLCAGVWGPPPPAEQPCVSTHIMGANI